MSKKNKISKHKMTPKEESEEMGCIVIEWLHRHYDYKERFLLSYFDHYGARVWLNGSLYLDREPTSTKSYTREEVMHDILEKLGYKSKFFKEKMIYGGCIEKENSD